MDAPKDFGVNQPFSLKKWQHMNWFNYDAVTSEWFPFNKSATHFSRITDKAGLAESTLKLSSFRKLIDDSSIAEIIILVLLVIAVRTNMTRQKQLRELVERHERLLTDIQAKLKKE